MNNPKKRLLITLYALYLTFILISCASYIGEQNMRGKVNENQYVYRLTFDEDGAQDHYVVALTDPTENGYVTVKYTVSSNTVEVKTQNIQTLEIDCRSIAVEKSAEILGSDYDEDSNAYKKYFIDKDVLHVKVDTDHGIILVLKDVPYPEKVMVNQAEFTNFQFSQGKVTTNVPTGYTEVDVYFTSDTPDAPSASIMLQRKIIEIDETLLLNGSGSIDPDGTIEDYLWDFGDGYYGQGMTISHSYTTPKIYRIYLTTRDNDGLIGTGSGTITVVEHGRDIDRDGMTDAWEDLFGIANPYVDTDGDGLDNVDEFGNGTDPTDPDTDDDGMPDGWEVNYGLDPLRYDANSDADNDDFTNLDEYLQNTDPSNRQSHPPVEEDEDMEKYLMPGIIIIVIIIIIIFTVIFKLRKSEVGPIVVKPYDKIAREVERTVRAKLKEESRKSIITSLAFKCPACGTSISPNAKVCPKCRFGLEEWQRVRQKLDSSDMPLTSTKVITRRVRK